MKPDLIVGSFATSFGAPGLWLIYFLVIFFFGLYSALLLYHWFKYGFDGVVRTMAAVYAIGALILLLLMTINILALT